APGGLAHGARRGVDQGGERGVVELAVVAHGPRAQHGVARLDDRGDVELDKPGHGVTQPAGVDAHSASRSRTTAARFEATSSASARVPASTMTRTRGSVPEGRV